MSVPIYQNRESILEDYKKLLEGLDAIFDTSIEGLNTVQKTAVALEGIMISLKKQKKEMTDGINQQFGLTEAETGSPHHQQSQQTAPQEAPRKLTSTTQQQ